jgi:hypothetical protein
MNINTTDINTALLHGIRVVCSFCGRGGSSFSIVVQMLSILQAG